MDSTDSAKERRIRLKAEQCIYSTKMYADDFIWETLKAREVLMATENNSVTTWRDRRQPDGTRIRDVGIEKAHLPSGGTHISRYGHILYSTTKVKDH